MVGKKSGKALLREEGLQRTDNGLPQTLWPQVAMINQKNYYTEYLKRDDQIFPLRLLQEPRTPRPNNEKDQQRAPADANGDVDMTMEAANEDDAEQEDEEEEEDFSGSRTIVIHPGSHYLRLGMASDALPKAVPMVIARRAKQNEWEAQDIEPLPKRIKLEGSSTPEPEKIFGPEWSAQYASMCADLKVRMRANKRRLLPNSKELVVNYNGRTSPDLISEHNDPMRIDWTEVPSTSKIGQDYFTGWEALRIPDKSEPRYKLFWPIQNGWFNEGLYPNRVAMLDDIATIIEDAIRKQLNLKKERDWSQYSCVLIIPDLYERQYVTSFLEIFLRDLGIGRIALIQESLAATFGAATTSACVVDVGAQKTSICCVEEGMCIENSRVNLKLGGADVTEAFMKMMLFDHFPYEDINLRRRYDMLLADELKRKFCTFNETEITVQLFDFHVRAPSQDTKKYQFKTYDEVLLAGYGLFQPVIFDNSHKLEGRHKLMSLSRDLYDDAPNDPTSAAQAEIIQSIAPPTKPPETVANGNNGSNLPASTPMRQLAAANAMTRVTESEVPSSALGTPAPEGDGGTPAPPVETETNNGPVEVALDPSLRDDVLPLIGLDMGILTSIAHGARGDERKTRDFLGGIMVVGGGSLTPGFLNALEERLKVQRPGFAKDIMIAPPPRELDPQGVAWKGGSVFAKLSCTSDLWIGPLEYDRLGARVLAYKTLWSW